MADQGGKEEHRDNYIPKAVTHVIGTFCNLSYRFVPYFALSGLGGDELVHSVSQSIGEH